MASLTDSLVVVVLVVFAHPPSRRNLHSSVFKSSAGGILCCLLEESLCSNNLAKMSLVDGIVTAMLIESCQFKTIPARFIFKCMSVCDV